MNTTWDEAVCEYLTAMGATNRSKGTIRLHRHKLSLLSRQHSSPWDVTLRDLRATLANEAWSAETRKSGRAVYRGFYRWAHGMEYMPTWIGEQPRNRLRSHRRAQAGA